MTIVVLLILAGVSISLILDNNGIIQKSKEVRRKYGQARENEQERLDSTSDWIEEQVTGKVPLAKISVGTKAKKNGTINGEEGNSNNPTIPKGYIPIDTTTSTWGDGSSAPSQDSVNHGLVIRDDGNNEWVWIPVNLATLATMYETSNDEKTLCGTAVTTNKYSKSEIISGQTRNVPGATTAPDFREPDLVVGWNGVAYDVYYRTILEFTSEEKMAEAFVYDYNEMIESIRRYGGFYIGRYELSETGVQKDKETLTNTNWYNLYKKCKELKASEKVETRMIWGCQWDITMNWLISSGAKTSSEVNGDSSSWGNYANTSVKADDGITEIKASGISSKLNTGETTFTMANNIYDLAGNCFEWTQEALTNSRAVRGGNYGGDGSELPASDRGAVSPDGSGFSSGYGKYYYQRYTSYFNNKIILEI